ncbi:hypothetical protein SUDANB28_01710 [Streptomyces sp. enrichment culture]
MLGGDDVPQGQVVGSGAVQDGGAADGHLGEFGGHGVAGPVAPGGGAGGAVDGGGQPVGDGGVSLRDGDPEGEHRLVRGVVVAREHQVGGVGLVGEGEAVGGAHPAALAVPGPGVAGVPDGDAHGLARVEVVVGGDHQILPRAGEDGRLAVDLDGVDGAVGEVQVDPVQLGGDPGVDGGDGLERPVVAAGIGEVQVVRLHVVAGVAEVREERVADAERLGGGARGDQADADGGGEQRLGGATAGAGRRASGGLPGGVSGGGRHATRLSARAGAAAAARSRPTRSGNHTAGVCAPSAVTGRDRAGGVLRRPAPAAAPGSRRTRPPRCAWRASGRAAGRRPGAARCTCGAPAAGPAVRRWRRRSRPPRWPSPR